MELEIELIYDLINSYPIKKKVFNDKDPWIESIIIHFFNKNLGKDHCDLFLSLIQEFDKLFYYEIKSDICNYNIRFSYRKKIAILSKKIFNGLEQFDLI